jgi:phospholipase/carboxylesterase
VAVTDIDPHAGKPVATAGAPPQVAEAVVVLLHGRGDSPDGILRLLDEIYHRGVRYVAPAAAGKVWFPGGFTDPLTDRRQAYLDSALGQVEVALDVAADIVVPPERVVVAGFSQGAAVALEYVTRRPRRYGGVAALAGGLLGPTDELASRDGGLAETPAFCGVGEDDDTVSVAHVEASAAVLRAMDADVTAEAYPGLGHAIGDGEVSALSSLIREISPESRERR